MKDTKKNGLNFHCVTWIMPQGWDLGVLEGVKNLGVGICDGAPLTAHSSYLILKSLKIKHIAVPKFRLLITVLSPDKND